MRANRFGDYSNIPPARLLELAEERGRQWTGTLGRPWLDRVRRHPVELRCCMPGCHQVRRQTNIPLPSMTTTPNFQVWKVVGMCGNHILEPPEQLPRSFTLDMLRRFDFTLPNTQNLSPLHSRVLEYPAITAHPGHPPWKCWVICFFGDGITRPRVELLDIYGLEINGKAPQHPLPTQQCLHR